MTYYVETYIDCMQGNNSLGRVNGLTTILANNIIANSLLYLNRNEEALAVLERVLACYDAFMSEDNSRAAEMSLDKFKNFDDEDALQMIYHNYAIALDRTGNAQKGQQFV